MWINIFVLLAGLVVLVYAADRFVIGAASIARNLGVSPLLIGLTVVGLGTSAPEILVAAMASWQGNSGLAIGNALGSNIANIGLILGVTAMIAPIAVHSKILKRELPILLATSFICFLLSIDGLFVIDGIIMLTGLVVFLWWLTHTAVKERKADIYSQEVEEEIPTVLPSKAAWIYFAMGLVGLLLSSRMLVWSAVNIAESFGISDLVIGLTIVALGTSLPELAASISSVLKKQEDLAIGNIIGSNMYNLLAVYSLPGIIAPGPIAKNVIERDFPVMLAFTGILFIIGYGVTKAGSIKQWEGLALVFCFGVYQWMIYQSVIA
jgi:cation:H+ antiporter